VALYEKTAPAWPAEKIEAYNHQLDGKILIPQPFGEIKNLYERDSGFAISKFMILELAAAVLLCVFFFWLARRMRGNIRPRGWLWNMFEAILIYFRDHVARPAIGGKEADRFVPLLWTLFLFILTCNLLGLLPWLGAPTGSFGVTFALAVVVFLTGLYFGMRKFGVLGYWMNQVPKMGLRWYMAIFIVPMIFLIEVFGLVIKHTVLGVRLLANMVAGHLVLLAVMGLAVAAAGSSLWGVTAVIAVVGSALFSCLELFVAFLQAYVFTFLSALFIGMAIHPH
jgi:F-type H+-transporting ATPase subunit a